MKLTNVFFTILEINFVVIFYSIRVGLYSMNSIPDKGRMIFLNGLGFYDQGEILGLIGSGCLVFQRVQCELVLYW